MTTLSNTPDAFILRPRGDIEEMLSRGAPTVLEPNLPLRGIYPDGQARRRERRQNQKHNSNPKR